MRRSLARATNYLLVGAEMRLSKHATPRVISLIDSRTCEESQL